MQDGMYFIQGEALLNENLSCVDKLCLMLFSENVMRCPYIEEIESLPGAPLITDKEVAWSLGLSLEQVEQAHINLNAAGWQTKPMPFSGDRGEYIHKIHAVAKEKGLDEATLRRGIAKLYNGKSLEELTAYEAWKAWTLTNSIKARKS